jgi:hypothetical protein
MKRVSSTLFCTLGAAVLLASMAFAEPAPDRAQASRERSAHTRDARPRYANTVERWRGRPYLRRAAAAHPASPTGSEVVYEHLPSVNFLLEGQYGGAFSVPRF